MEHNCTNCFYNFVTNLVKHANVIKTQTILKVDTTVGVLKMAWNLVNIGGQMKNERS